ncbi:MAG: TetR/AcrR family transcriptional regulator [Actinomycetota bacterium]|nr:TetR/AcrR family transcriptional regulator [Actinomycetota bacterium]
MGTPKARRGEPATERRAAIESAVLQTTEQLLEEGHSYADLNVERIARGAGISRTAFYFYFADKRELLMRLSEGVSALLYERAQVWWQGEGADRGELHAALSQIGELYNEHGALLRAIVEVSTYDDEIAVFWRALVGRFVEATRGRIEREQAGGRADETLEAGAVAFSLVWMTERTLYEVMMQEGPMTREALMDALTAIWERSVFSGDC